MPNTFQAALRNLRSLETLASGESVVHRLAPEIKLVVTLAYIVCVVSFGRYDVGGLIPFLAYPGIVVAAAKIPWRMIAGRIAIALPFVFFIGIGNLITDAATVTVFGTFAMRGGAVSFVVILLKTALTVSAVLVLAATTPVNYIAAAMRKLRVPCVMVLLLLLIWRYLEVLISEAHTMYLAYSLRAQSQRAVKFRDWPALCGTLLTRSLDRAERIYDAMLCRGFNPHMPARAPHATPPREIVFCGTVCALFVAARFAQQLL